MKNTIYGFILACLAFPFSINASEVNCRLKSHLDKNFKTKFNTVIFSNVGVIFMGRHSPSITLPAAITQFIDEKYQNPSTGEFVSGREYTHFADHYVKLGVYNITDDGASFKNIIPGNVSRFVEPEYFTHLVSKFGFGKAVKLSGKMLVPYDCEVQ